MIQNDDKLIWGALINERRNPDADTYDAEGELPGPIDELDPAYGEDEEGGCPNLDKLIASAESDEEEHEDSENVGVDIEPAAAEWEAEKTPF